MPRKSGLGGSAGGPGPGIPAIGIGLSLGLELMVGCLGGQDAEPLALEGKVAATSPGARGL